MQIKLKNKKEISVFYNTSNYEHNCRWCGKTIKAGKPHYYSLSYGGALSGDYCSVAHLKAASNAEL